MLTYDASLHFGRVAYTHGPDTDQPLSAIRINFTRAVYDNHTQGWHARTWSPLVVAPHWNWRGQPEIGALANGEQADCYSSSFDTWCARIPWRIRPFAFTQQPADTIDGWWGGFLRDKEDGTGTLFRRNRYLDPATGRFTQEDPIGLAGGLNLYGFAAGDPVNFSDPFGLGPCKNYPPGQCPAWLAAWERASEALNNVGLALAGVVSSISDFVTGGAAGHVWTAGSGIGADGQTVGTGERFLLAGLAMAEMVPGETVIFSGRKVTNALARTLRIERRDLGGRIESIKKAAGLPGNLNVRITSLGNVLRKDTGELIGNVFDELPH